MEKEKKVELIKHQGGGSVSKRHNEVLKLYKILTKNYPNAKKMDIYATISNEVCLGITQVARIIKNENENGTEY